MRSFVFPATVVAASLSIALLILAGCRATDNRTTDGRRIAELWCAECHRVSPDDPTGGRPGHVLPPSMPAPSFMTIAARPGVDADWLRRFADELHLPMPIYRLPREQQEQVIAYILSLRPAGETAGK